jgi:hypothetical protein
MGRKSISGVRKSDRPLRIRLTEEERAELDAAAGESSTSTWARDLLLREARKPKKKR